TYTPKKNIQALVVSSSKLVLNESYDVYVDGTKTVSFTQSAVVTSSVTNQGGQGGGQPGGRN
ncbi:MAG: LuxR family transcriptional regulator, partial [Bacilli bacterium]